MALTMMTQAADSLKAGPPPPAAATSMLKHGIAEDKKLIIGIDFGTASTG